MIMKKVALAVSLLGLSGGALAEVQLYGNVQAGVERTKSAEPRTVISSDGSYIGFKGSEYLGGGTKAIWQIEQGVEFGSNDNREDKSIRENMRDSYVGLQNGAGSVKLGKLSLPFEQVTRQMDLNKDRNASLHGFYGRTDERNNGSILVESANFGGVKGAVGYSQDTNTSQFSGLENKTKTTSASLEYDVGSGVIASAAYEQARDFAVADDRKRNAVGQLGFKFSNGAAIRAGYEHMKYRSTNTVSQGVASVTGTVPVGDVDLSANYTRTLKMKVNGEKVAGDANIYTVKAKYNLSKRTAVDGHVTRIDNRNSAYGFPNAQTLTVGENQYNYGVTLSHKF